MTPKKIIAMVMTFLMMFSLLPSLVFAAAVPEGALGGQLKIKGTAAVGSELSADYTKVTPEGLSDDDVTFSWSRKVDDKLTEVGTEKTYKLVDEDLGNKIELKITGKSELGITGELKVNTVAIVATPEEAPEETTELPEEKTGDAAPAEENVIDIGSDESADPSVTAAPSEEQPTEEQPAEEQPVQEQPAEVGDSASLPDSTTDDSVINIGTEDYLEVPEGGQTEAPAQELTYSAEAVCEDGSTVLDFGTVNADFTQDDANNSMVKYITIKNTGTGTLNFKEISPEHFMVQDLSSLAAGESANIWVMPREGTAVGQYSDTITYATEEGVEVSFTADLIVEETEKGSTDPQNPAEEEGPSTPVEPSPTAAPPEPTPTAAPVEPTPTETPVVNNPVIETVDGVASVEFTDTDIIQEQGTEGKTRTVTLKNSGTGTVKLAASAEGGKVAVSLDKDELPAGDATVVLTIQPKDTSTVGAVTDKIIVANAEDGKSLFEIPVSYTVQEKPVCKLAADISEVKFDSKEAGYTEAPAAVTVNVSNAGNTKLTGLTVSITGSEFAVSAPSLTELEANAGQTVSFTVAPVTGLAAGSYAQTISIKTDQTDYLTIPVSFTVSEAVIKLISVGKVSDISVANGVEKSASGLQLPSTVKITTSKDKMNASVKWDVKGCAYNQKSAEAQKFSVKGTVALPDGVTNPDNLNLVVSVNVSVSRGAIVSDAANNTITGISSDGSYTTETKITFTAVGAGMDIENPIKGDVRYLPLNWEVLEARSWDGAPYSATFRMGKNGNYTLTVTYNQQKFDGSNWVNTGTQDTKQVNFTVNVSPNQTLTPAANKADANQKNAVKTGDNTPILPFVIILVVAVVLIAGILVYRNKKK